MSWFGGIKPGSPDFINVLEGARGEVEWTAVVRRAEARLTPYVLWISRTIGLTVSLEIGPKALLAFAPGARLILRNGSRLTLQGRLQVMSGACFEAQAGQVELLGPLDAIDASWWLGGTESALRAALDTLWSHVAQRRREVAFLCMGEWVINRTVEVVPPAGQEDGVRVKFIGASSSGSELATFTAGTGLEGPLFRVLGGVVTHWEDVGFRDNEQPRRSGEESLVELAGLGSGVQFRRCWWNSKGARSAVRLHPPLEGKSDSALETELDMRRERPPTRIGWEGCDFRAGHPSLTIVRGSERTPYALEFRSCAFGGRYDAAILVYGGSLLVEGSTFHNEHWVRGLGVVRVVAADVKSDATDLSRRLRTRQQNAFITLLHCTSASQQILSLLNTWGDYGSPPVSAAVTSVVQLANANADPNTRYTSMTLDARFARRGLLLQGVQLLGAVALYGESPPAFQHVVSIGSTMVMYPVGRELGEGYRLLVRDEVELMQGDRIDP